MKVKVSPIPYYAQVRDALREKILNGTLASHDRMPSENQLTEMFCVSRITVRQALKQLEREGLIFSVQGKGSFVSKPKAFQDLAALQSFGEAMHPLGHQTYSKIISVKEVVADSATADRLMLGKSGKAVELKRVRYLDAEPASFETSYFPLAIGRKLVREDLSTQDILLIVENTLGIEVGHANLVLGAHLADDAQARLLNIPEGAPMIHIERLTNTTKPSPLMFEHLFHRGDSFRYTVTVQRK